jgi:hypothetical protein
LQIALLTEINKPIILLDDKKKDLLLVLFAKHCGKIRVKLPYSEILDDLGNFESGIFIP